MAEINDWLMFMSDDVRDSMNDLMSVIAYGDGDRKLPENEGMIADAVNAVADVLKKNGISVELGSRSSAVKGSLEIRDVPDWAEDYRWYVVEYRDGNLYFVSADSRDCLQYDEAESLRENGRNAFVFDTYLGDDEEEE